MIVTCAIQEGSTSASVGLKNAEKIREALNTLKYLWGETVSWSNVASMAAGSSVFRHLKDTSEALDDFIAQGTKKCENSPAKRKARELREQADKLLAQAKDLEATI